MSRSSPETETMREEMQECGTVEAFEEADFAILYREINESGTTTLQEITNVPQVFCQEIARQLRGHAQCPDLPTDKMVEAAAREMWNDRDARHGGSWDSRSADEVCVIQTKATARAALIAALAASPDTSTVCECDNGGPCYLPECVAHGCMRSHHSPVDKGA